MRCKKESTIDPRFVHLTIHYSQRTDTPDTKNPARPRYVANEETNQAYRVSDLIEPYIRKGSIVWYTHDGVKAVKAYFKKRRISPNEMKPSTEELGLRFSEDGSLTKRLEEPDIVSRLRGHKLKDLEILWMFPWYYAILPSRMGDHPPDKTLLRKISTNETFHAPVHNRDLYENGIISHDNKRRRPCESLRKWSERKGYTYRDRRFTEDDLLKEAVLS